MSCQWMLRSNAMNEMIDFEENRVGPAPMFQAMVEGSTAGMYIIQDWKFLYANRRLEEMFGYTRAELTAMENFLDLVYPDDRQLVEEKVKARLFGESISARYNSRWIRKDGQVIHIEVIGAKTVNDGRPAVMGTLIDITRRRHTEEDLKQSLRQQKAILDNIPDMAWLKDRDCVYIAANEQFGRACGHSPEDVVGKNDLGLWPMELAERYRADDAEVMRTGMRKSVEEPLTDSKGRRIWIHTIKTPIFDESGEVVGTTGIARDITVRKGAEEELKKFKFILDQAGEEFYLISKSGEIRYANEAAARNLGCTMEGMLELRILDIDINCDEKWWGEHFAALKKEDLPPFEVTHKTKHGRLVPKEVKSVHIDIGGTEYVCAFIRDITERKGLERQRADFFAMVTHDLKSPLSAILGYAELMLMNKAAALDKDNVEMVSAIQRSGARILALVEDFLALSRLEAGTLEANLFPMDVFEALRETELEFLMPAAQKGLELKSELGLGFPMVNADRKLLHRAVSNLIQNAINYTPAGGTITLEAGLAEDASGRSIVISVADTGPGMSADVMEKVFDRYYRAPKTSGIKGTGLGLAIVKAVAEAHGGRVEVESIEGSGSTFRLILPVKQSLPNP